MISLNKAHYPVTVLGPGRRAGVWLQGCSLQCVGCVSLDTWERRSDVEIPVDSVLSWIAGLDAIDGVTISGGEPFDQPKALGALLEGLDVWRRKTAQTVDLLVYSGYTLGRLRRVHPHLLTMADAIITGRFVSRRASNLVWRGSENQDLLPLTELGEERYREHIGRRVQQGALQAMVDGDSIWYIGVPLAGEMDRIDDALLRAGVQQGAVSWKS